MKYSLVGRNKMLSETCFSVEACMAEKVAEVLNLADGETHLGRWVAIGPLESHEIAGAIVALHDHGL